MYRSTVLFVIVSVMGACVADLEGGEDVPAEETSALVAGPTPRSLRIQHSGLCIGADLSGGWYNPDDRVKQFSCHNGTNQAWEVVNHLTGRVTCEGEGADYGCGPETLGFYLYNVGTNKCLERRNGNNAVHSQPVLASCTWAENQRWELTSTGDPTYRWRVQVPRTWSPAMCLDIPSFSRNTWEIVQLYGCKTAAQNNDNQSFLTPTVVTR